MSANFLGHRVDGLRGIDDDDLRVSSCFGEEAFAQFSAIFSTASFKPVGGPGTPRVRGIAVHVEQEGERRLDAHGGNAADAPQFVDVEPAGLDAQRAARDELAVSVVDMALYVHHWFLRSDCSTLLPIVQRIAMGLTLAWMVASGLGLVRSRR